MNATSGRAPGTVFRVALTGVRYAVNYSCTLAPAYLKAYADSRPDLAGKISIELLQRTTLDAPADIIRDILAGRPDLAGFSCYIWNMDRVLEICRLLRGHAPGLKIILGGPEASPQAERLLREAPYVDYICVGEGEAAFAELLNRLSSDSEPEGVAGLVWRKDGVPVIEAERLPIEDLDSIPSPLLLGLVPLTSGDRFVLETTRGCPFKCGFCDWQNGQKTRYFSIGRVLKEAAFLLENIPKFEVFVSDADLFRNLPRAKALLKELGPLVKGRWCRFSFQTWLPGLDEETFTLLDTEQFILAAGVESMNAPALKAMSRASTNQGVEQAIGRMRRLAPRCRLELQLIYGVPGDNLQGFRSSLDWALSKNPDMIFLPHALALPGADFGRRPGKFGLTVEPGPPHRILAAPGFPAGEIEAASCLAFRIGAFNDERCLHWLIDRLCGLGGAGPLALWEELLARIEEEVPSAALRESYESADAVGRAFFHACNNWRYLLPFNVWLRISGVLKRFAFIVFARSGRSADWPAFECEFRRRRLWLLLKKAQGQPLLLFWARRADALCGRPKLRVGRFWQSCKYAIISFLRGVLLKH